MLTKLLKNIQMNIYNLNGKLSTAYSRLRISNNIKNKFDSFCKIPFLTKNEIIKIQTKRLHLILKDAISTVPFYKNIKIDSSDFSLNELKKFPIINNKIIQDKPDAFISSNYNKKNGKWGHTSGSSGKQFNFLVPLNSDVMEYKTMFRAWNMGSSYSIGDPVIMFRSYCPKPKQKIFKKINKYNYWYLSAFDINQKNYETIINFIIKSNSSILRGYPSSIYILTLLLEKNNTKLNQIKKIITSSETLLDKYRTKIETYFKLNIQDWYGLNERIITVQQCEYENYHNNDDYGIIELNDNNQIIGTSLINNIMPLIRYNTEDFAEKNEIVDKCLCGRNFSIPFDQILGRSDDLLYKFDKTSIPSVNLYTAMQKFPKILQFKLIQDIHLNINLQYVSNQNLSNNDKIDIIKEISMRLGKVKIIFSKVKQIERDKKTGKIKVCESHFIN